MRRPCPFKERDVKRAGRAVLAMGLQIGRVEIDKNGSIIVVPAETKKTADEASGRNEWDDTP